MIEIIMLQIRFLKGFDVATGNPRKGTIIARYDGVNFYIDIEPVFNDNTEGGEAENRPFDEVVKDRSWVFR